MDGTHGSASNKKMLLDEQNNGEGQDRISSLPASVLHHILSFLPTKYAVGTSILSTRWKYLWTSVSKLDFSDELLYSTKKSTKNNSILATTFKNFVNRVLLLHDGLSIDRFRLSCTALYDHNHVNMWITTLLRRNVQNLVLSIPLKGAFVFPRCLFCCESLTELKIDIEDVCYFRVPTQTCFPNLKVLHLELVTFCAAEHSVQEVFFSFPVLEYMIVWRFRMMINTVNISAPSLKTLAAYDSEDESIANCNFVVDAKSLYFINLESNFSCKYSLYNLSSVDEAIIDVDCPTTMLDPLIKLLGDICNVKNLSLAKTTFDSLFCVKGALAHLQSFSSLVNLTVTSDSDDIDASILMRLLHKMPCMECLSLCASYTFNDYDDIIPQCILSHLKFVELNYFLGRESELCLVKLLLTNARPMEKMTIRSTEELSKDSNKQLDVTKQLLMMIPRASACCVIDFA